MWQSVVSQLCACLELGTSDGSPEQLNLLHQGGKFVRSLYLGFSSQELLMELSLDNAIIKWKTVDATEFGEIDFSGNIKTVKSTGQQVSLLVHLLSCSLSQTPPGPPIHRQVWKEHL